MISLRKLAQSCALASALILMSAHANAGFLFGYVVGSMVAGNQSQGGTTAAAIVPYYPAPCYLGTKHPGLCLVDGTYYTLEQRCTQFDPSAVPVGVQMLSDNTFIVYCGFKKENTK